MGQLLHVLKGELEQYPRSQAVWRLRLTENVVLFMESAIIRG
jgi:hypothetical protein